MKNASEQEIWICVWEGEDVYPLSSQATGNPMKSIGLPLMSATAMDMLLNAAARTGGWLGNGPTSAALELRGLGLVGPRMGLTRRGGALTHLLQCLFFEGSTECGRCAAARHSLATRR